MHFHKSDQYLWCWVIGVVACADPTPVAHSLVADSAGTEIVSNREAAGVEVRLVETLRLGTTHQEGPEQFSRINGVVMDSNGTIFIANGGTSTIREFSPDGRFLAEYGGSGEGPAEFTQVNDLVVAGDTLIGIDWQRMGKVVLFSTSRGFLASWSLRSSNVGSLPIARTTRGWLWAEMPAQTPRIRGGDSLVMSARIVTRGFDAADSGVLTYAFPTTTLYGTGAGGGEGAIDWGLFRHQRYLGFDSIGRLFVTAPDAYRIDVWDGDALIRSIRLDVAVKKIRKADVERVAAEALAIVDTITGLPDGYRTQEKAGIAGRIERQAELPIPDVLSPISGLLVSPDGSFWVQRTNATNPAKSEAARFYERNPFPGASTQWDVYSTSGAFVGSVQLPPRFRAEAVDGRTVIGVLADSLDVEHVIRFEVR